MTIGLVQTDGIETAYFSFGRGEKPFVILPGIDTKSILQSAKAVETAYRRFADAYTVYVFDRRKHLPPDATVQSMAADTAAAMCALGIRDADIFGASQGGMIAMCIAIEAPVLVRKLVLGSTAASADSTIIAGVRHWISLAEQRDMAALTADFVDRLYSPDTIGRYRELLLHRNDHVSDEDIERFIIQARAIERFDITAELGRITCPTLVIGAQGDRVLPPACSRRIADALGCELYLYGPEYGHCVFDEAPDFQQRILDFFKK